MRNRHQTTDTRHQPERKGEEIITLTLILSRRGRGRNIWEYIPYSNFPSTGGRELKGGGIRADTKVCPYNYTKLRFTLPLALAFPQW